MVGIVLIWLHFTFLKESGNLDTMFKIIKLLLVPTPPESSSTICLCVHDLGGN